jgi:hypothetical protein
LIIFIKIKTIKIMKKVMISVITTCVLISFIACSGSADKKVPALANEMCGCFDKFQQSLSADAMGLMKSISTAANPQSEMMDGLSKLKQEDALSFGEKMKSIGTKGSEVYTCMEAFDKKHSKETTKDRNSLMEKLLKEMKANGNCPVGAAIVNLSLAKTK